MCAQSQEQWVEEAAAPLQTQKHRRARIIGEIARLKSASMKTLATTVQKYWLLQCYSEAHPSDQSEKSCDFCPISKFI